MIRWLYGRKIYLQKDNGCINNNFVSLKKLVLLMIVILFYIFNELINYNFKNNFY